MGKGKDILLISSRRRKGKISSSLRDLLDPDRFSYTNDKIPKVDGEDFLNKESLKKESNVSSLLKRFSIEEVKKDSGSDVVKYIKIDSISFSPYQTRKIQSEEEVGSLSESILENGLLQPIIVREKTLGSKKYELVAGERRYRAFLKAKIKEIPAIVKRLENEESAKISVIENAQRENLNPIEEALSFKTLLTSFNMTQSEISKLVGKSRVYVSNSLRLLNLNDEVKVLVIKGVLSAGHARALLALNKDPKSLKMVLDKTLRDSLSVRELEKLVLRVKENRSLTKKGKVLDPKRAFIKKQEEQLRDSLSIKLINLSYDKRGRKRLQLTFESDKEWDRFLSKIRREEV